MMHFHSEIRLFLLCFLFMVTKGQRCAVNTSIPTFPENVPAGTVVLEFTLNDDEEWIFDEAEPMGYLDFDVDGFNVMILLSQTPDIEEINKQYAQYTDSLRYTLECSCGGQTYIYEQTVKILDINEYSPRFRNSSNLHFTLSERTPANTRVFDLLNTVIDDDITGRVEKFAIEPHVDIQQDGNTYFKISQDGLAIVLSRPVDYEAYIKQSGILHLNISAQDNGYPVAHKTFANITIVIIDEDDQDPSFVYPECDSIEEACVISEYSATINEFHIGLLRLEPAQVKAVDMDSMHFPIRYSLIEVMPSDFGGFFKVDNKTGEITLLFRLEHISGGTVRLTIKANEVSQKGRSNTAEVTIRQISDSSFATQRVMNGKDPNGDKLQNIEETHKKYPHNDAVYLKNWLPYVHIMLVIISLMCLLWCTLMVVVFKILRKNRNALNTDITMNGYRQNKQPKTTNVVVEEGITAFRSATPERLDITPFAKYSKPKDLFSSRLSPPQKHVDLFSCGSSSTSSSRGLVSDSPMTPRSFRNKHNLSDSSFTIPPRLPLCCNTRLPMLKYGSPKSESRMKISFDSKGDTYI